MRKCPFFLRGCPLICIKNRTFLLSLIFFEKDLDIMFKYLLNNMKNFLDYKNVILTYSKHDHFAKGGKPRIFVKNLKILLSLIFFERDLHMMSNNVLNKKGLSRLEKCHFNIVGQCPYFQRG